MKKKYFILCRFNAVKHLELIKSLWDIARDSFYMLLTHYVWCALMVFLIVCMRFYVLCHSCISCILAICCCHLS